MASTISVIIPTLNEEAAIGSLLRQLVRMPDVEIIVSDGGSKDRTTEICRSFAVKCVQGAVGRGRQLNSGVQSATGDIFFFLHADSSLEERVFNDIRQAVQSGNRWGCCSLSFNENTLFFRLLAAASRWRVKLASSCYGDQGIYCEKDLFHQVGGFPEFPFLEDLTFSQRVRRFEKARMLPGKITTSTRRFRQNGLWRTLLKMQAVKLLFSLGVSPDKLIGFYQTNKEG